MSSDLCGGEDLVLDSQSFGIPVQICHLELGAFVARRLGGTPLAARWTGLGKIVDVNRQVIELCVEGLDGIDEVATVVVIRCGFCAESAKVLEMDTNIADLPDQGIDCLSNLRACPCKVNWGNTVAGVVSFGKGVVLINRILIGVDGMVKAWYFVRVCVFIHLGSAVEFVSEDGKDLAVSFGFS